MFSSSGYAGETFLFFHVNGVSVTLFAQHMDHLTKLLNNFLSYLTLVCEFPLPILSLQQLLPLRFNPSGSDCVHHDHFIRFVAHPASLPWFHSLKRNFFRACFVSLGQLTAIFLPSWSALGDLALNLADNRITWSAEMRESRLEQKPIFHFSLCISCLET